MEDQSFDYVTKGVGGDVSGAEEQVAGAAGDDECTS